MLSLEEIKSTEFDILCHFKKFADENNIQFMLSNGTLLGAVKYNGFIPWDDDIDIFVPREDYQRMINLYKDNSKYKLYSIDRESKFYFPYAKLADIRTKKIEKNIKNGIEQGVDIDIFPLDDWGGEDKIELKQKKIMLYMQMLNFSKLEFNRGKSIGRTIAKAILIAITRFIGPKFFVKKIIKLATSENDSGLYQGCVVWPIYGKREIISSSVFSDKIEVEFEGEKFPAPAGYDVYLRSLYGNYIQDPPRDKQKTHHNFEAYRL